jgi:hypothetical protein
MRTRKSLSTCASRASVLAISAIPVLLEISSRQGALERLQTAESRMEKLAEDELDELIAGDA